MFVKANMLKVKFDRDVGTSRVEVVKNEGGTATLVIYTDSGECVDLFFKNIDDVYTIARTIINLIDELEKEDK